MFKKSTGLKMTRSKQNNIRNTTIRNKQNEEILKCVPLQNPSFTIYKVVFQRGMLT